MYETEEEQIKALKDWWSENGTSIIVGVVIGVGGFIGYNWWQDSVVAKQEQASVAFEALTDSNIDDNFEGFEQQAESIKSDYTNTGYGLVAALHLAKQYAEKSDFDAAIKQLEWAVTASAGHAVQPLLKIRLASTLAASQNYDAAIAQLESISDSAFDALRQQAMGDIYRAQGKLEQARAAYVLAQDNSESFALTNQLDMIIDDLSVAKIATPLSSEPGKPAPEQTEETSDSPSDESSDRQQQGS